MSIDLLRFVREKLCRSGLVRNQLIVIGMNVAASLPLRRHLSWLRVHLSTYLSRSLSLSLPLSVSTKSIQVIGRMITFLWFMFSRFQSAFTLLLMLLAEKVLHSALVWTTLSLLVEKVVQSCRTSQFNFANANSVRCVFSFGVTTAYIEAS